MINVLLIDDDFSICKHLMRYINRNENVKDVRVLDIAADGEEALNILNNTDDIDIFVLDLKMPMYDGVQLLNMISEEKRKKYRSSCIVMSGDVDYMYKLKGNQNEMIYCILSKSCGMSGIVDKILDVVKFKQKEKEEEDISKKITDELLNLKYNLSHIGTRYLIDVIFYIRTKNIRYDNLKKDIYPQVARVNRTTVHNVKGNITRATDNMYYSCPKEKLLEYFSMSEEAKPKTKTIIETVLRKI